MDTVTKERARAVDEKADVTHSTLLDWGVALASLWMLLGVYLDSWAHHRFDLESFFTPWHAVMYTGYLGAALLLAGTWLRARLSRPERASGLPAGYRLSLLGAGVFLVGGLADMVWHTFFGIEVSLEALFSPPHLFLALGGALIGTGPLRAAMHREGSGPPGIPVLLSLVTLYAVLAFFTGFAHPLIEVTHAPPRAFLTSSLMVASILLQSGLLMGVVLLAVRRWRLAFGSFTLIFTLTTALAVIVHENFELLPFALLAGLAADALIWWLKPGLKRPAALRLFAFTTPAIFYSLFFATLWLNGDLHWRVHLWAGTIVMSGVVGWLLSFLIVAGSED